VPPHGLATLKSNLNQFLRIDSHDDYCLSTHDDASMCAIVWLNVYQMCPTRVVLGDCTYCSLSKVLRQIKP